ncbi:MAG: hypothetical protein VYB93_10955 [Pseudomonadota bacterium]|jgi:hypothetical protein|nr:hypothetical protein [Pseudomonadota bacterium]
MDITEQHPANNETLEGLMCDRCKTRLINDGLESMFEMAEFVRIRIHSGYGAKRFDDGDVREIDLCENCSYELFALHARLIRSGGDQAEVVTPHTPESEGPSLSDIRIGGLIR